MKPTPSKEEEDKSIDAASPFVGELKNPGREVTLSRAIKRKFSPVNTPTVDLSSASIHDLSCSPSGYPIWPPQYTNLSSRPILNTNAETISTNCTPIFECPVGSLLAASANFDHHTGSPYPHGPRIETSLHRDIASPVIYGASAPIQYGTSSQMNLQASTAPANWQNMAYHPYQIYADPIDQRYHPFQD